MSNIKCNLLIIVSFILMFLIMVLDFAVYSSVESILEKNFVVHYKELNLFVVMLVSAPIIFASIVIIKFAKSIKNEKHNVSNITKMLSILKNLFYIEAFLVLASFYVVTSLLDILNGFLFIVSLFISISSLLLALLFELLQNNIKGVL